MRQDYQDARGLRYGLECSETFWGVHVGREEDHPPTRQWDGLSTDFYCYIVWSSKRVQGIMPGETQVGSPSPSPMPQNKVACLGSCQDPGFGDLYDSPILSW